MEITHDSLKAVEHPIGHDIGIFGLGMAIGIATALVDLNSFPSNFLLQHAASIKLAGSSSRDIAGDRPGEAVGLVIP